MNDLSHHGHDRHTHHDHGAGHHESSANADTGKPFTDPVCGMNVAADPAKEIEHEGTVYHFSSTRCMDKFRAQPRQYLDTAEHAIVPKRLLARSTHVRCTQKFSSLSQATARFAA